MKALERMIASISPSWALKRAQSRMMLRSFDAVKPNRLRTLKRARAHIDSDTRQGTRPVREMARWLEQNYDLVTGALDVLVRNVVGGGIVPEPLVRLRNGDLAVDFNAELSGWFDVWSNAPEVTGELDYAEAQRTKALTLFRDGEVFMQYLMGEVRALTHGTEIPFSIELIDPDQVPISVSDYSRNIVQGVRKNQWGRPMSYLVAPHQNTETLVASQGYRTISANRLQHLKIMRRIRQTRGVSVLASALERIEDIRSYDESERVAAVISASMAAYIKRGNPDLFNADSMERDENGNLVPREHKFQAGMIYDFLEPGEDIGTVDTNRPNPNLGRYRDDQLRAASAGIGCSFSSMARNYEGNYSSRRQEANEMTPQYGMLWGYFCARGEYPTWSRLIDVLLASRIIGLQADIDLSSLYDCEFSRPATPSIDRQKEVSADAQALETYQDSLADIWRRNGKKPADMWRKLTNQASKLPSVQDAAPSSAQAEPEPPEGDNETEKEEAA